MFGNFAVTIVLYCLTALILSLYTAPTSSTEISKIAYQKLYEWQQQAEFDILSVIKHSIVDVLEFLREKWIYGVKKKRNIDWSNELDDPYW